LLKIEILSCWKPVSDGIRIKGKYFNPFNDGVKLSLL